MQWERLGWKMTRWEGSGRKSWVMLSHVPLVLLNWGIWPRLETWISSVTDENAGVLVQINVGAYVIYVTGLVPCHYPPWNRVAEGRAHGGSSFKLVDVS